MRILVLYDIHGNSAALAAVLADPRARGAELVVIGGDTVPGPFAAEALGLLDALEVPVRALRGNGEREVAAHAAAGGAPDASADDVTAAGDAHTVTDIGARRARALGELPATLVADGILFCHATPDSDEALLTRLTPDAEVARALAGVDARLVVAGHTHQQDDRTLGATRFVNAGSVGMPYEGDAAAFWLWIEDGEPHARRTAYDALAAGERARAAGWPDMESLEASLISPMEAIEVTRVFEGQRADGA